MTSKPLIGTWSLISWQTRNVNDQKLSYPFGKHPVGYLMYSADGYMSVAIMRSNRVEFAARDLLLGSTEEKAQAASTYLSYCGRYEFRGDVVIHHVEACLFPNWVGGEQERLVELKGNRLTLSTHPMLLRGKLRSARLIWERI